MPEPRMLLAPNPGPMTLDGTRTFVVGRARPVVIDPGPDNEAHLQALLALLAEVPPAAILLTHHHADHAGAAMELRRATGAAVHVAGAFGGGLAGLQGGERFESDQGTLVAMRTPGHTPHDMSFHWVEANALFVGDTFMGSGDTTLVAPPQGDLAAYLQTLDRVEELAPAVLYPAHGPPIADPLAAVGRYRRHREERIAQVVQALSRGGAQRATDLLAPVYGAALDPGLRGAAEGSLQAILAYLIAVGRATRHRDGRYSLTAAGG